jgi:hypothetical protein
MTIVKEPVRRRAPSGAVEQKRRERRAAAPIVARLNGWHERSARLTGIAHHRMVHGLSCEDLKAEVDALGHEIVAELDAWRTSRGDVRPTGYLFDAERSCRSVLAMLDALSRRLG